MKKSFNFKKELPFSENISNITSISLDTSFEESGCGVKGTFLVEGNYKTHELSLNKKDFKYELDFEEELDNMIEGSLNLEVEDFTYDVEDNNLIIDIDYETTYEEKIEENEELDEEEFNRFLEDHEVDIVNLNEIEEQTEINPIEEVEERENLADNDDFEEINNLNTEIKTEENENEKIDINVTSNEEKEDATEAILKTIDKEEKYITYHVYVCESDDTFESISEKFNTNKEEIREYNEIDDIEYGRKIIIPVKDE